MNKQPIDRHRVPIRLVLVAAVLATSAVPAAGAAIAGDDDNMSAQQARLREVVASMPAGWPATEAMKRAAEEPLGEAAERTRWRLDAERLPAGWPATDAMLDAAGEPLSSEVSTMRPQGFRAHGNAATLWNAHAGDAAIAACLSPTQNPLHESRLYAMTHIAIHDALNAIRRRFEPYALHTVAPHATSPEAAVAAAARGVLAPTIAALPPALVTAECIEAGIASVEANYQAALAAIADGPDKEHGIALGQQAAAAIVAARADDGFDTPPLVDPAYPQGDEPGEYRFTPGTPFAFAPLWGEVTPFVLRESAQFRARPPYPLTSRRYARDVAEIQRLGGDGTTTPSERTAEQTEIALFWVESSPLAWNRIARDVAIARGLDVWESARLFGLLNMGLADGYIGSFETKYLYNFWRPVTAIRLADTDGNPHTIADPSWTPLVTTPPIPDHDSAHSVEGAVAAQVMRRVFGTNRVTFQACSRTLPEGRKCGQPAQVLRSFPSFSQAADENGESRILVGFHFRRAVDEGLDHGRDIGNRAVSHYMRPVR